MDDDPEVDGPHVFVTEGNSVITNENSGIIKGYSIQGDDQDSLWVRMMDIRMTTTMTPGCTRLWEG